MNGLLPSVVLSYLLLCAGVFPAWTQPPNWFDVKPTDNSLLFKISGKGIKKHCYIYGTMHYVCEKEVNLAPSFTEAFHKSKQLYLEVDLDNVGELLTAQINLLLPVDSSLKHLLTTEDYQFAQQFFQDSLKKDIEQYESIRPIVLTGVLYPNIMGCSKPIAFEQILKSMAKKEQMPIYGLEKVTAQINAFDKIPLRIQANSLMKAIRNYQRNKVKQIYIDMHNYYWSNNLQYLSEILLGDPLINYNTSGFEDILLFERNRKWIPVILQAAKKEPTFFAFGAAHLVGENGVINLLRKEGYKVVPIRY